MKKAILTILIAAALTIISMASYGQAKTSPVPVKKDTAKVDPVLHIDLTKDQAKEVLSALQTSVTGLQESDQISGKQLSHAMRVYDYFITLIYKKWPDLVPKQTQTN